VRNNFIYCLQRLVYAGVFISFFVPHLNAQELWSKVTPSFSSFKIQQSEAYYKLNELKEIHKNKTGKTGAYEEFILPNEKGEQEKFEVVSIPILSLELSKRYPELKTFEGVSISRPGVRIRLSSHPNGINAWLKLPEAADFFIQTLKGKKQLHYTYLKTDENISQKLFCKTNSSSSNFKFKKSSAKSSTNKSELKTFRIAIATTAEYTSFWGDNDDTNGTNTEDALGAVISTLNRISSVFEDELGIRLQLVSDDSLLYEDPESDPFTGSFEEELQNTLDEIIGDDAYDVGHLFDYGQPNGDAGCIGCVCASGSKGRGYSTHPFRDIFGGEYRNDYFDLDYAAHEIGHQFGALHSFSFDAEGTGYNAEPGSGSTIMGYAGIAGEDNVQLHGDPYFHYYSIQNILEELPTFGCATTESYNLDVFTIDAGKDYSIPIGTAYELLPESHESQAGTTFCWEQLDSGQVTSASFGPYDAKGALARSLPPSESALRTIPNMNQVLLGDLTQENPVVDDSWETVPLVARSMKWGLSVRKSSESGIQLAQDFLSINVLSSSGPFELTSQNEPSVVWKGGTRETVEWNVANTDERPIAISAVTIYLSSDGGLTFSHLLADDVPNTGTAEVLIPNTIDTSEARLKIKAKGGIFFAVNSANFTIQSSNLILQFEKHLQENCNSNSIQYDFTLERKEGYDDTFSLQLNDLPSGVQAQLSRTTFSTANTFGSLTLTGIANLEPADYSLLLKTITNNETKGFEFVLKQRSASISPAVLISPLNKAVAQDINTLLLWGGDLNSDASQVQLSLSGNFNEILTDTIVSKNQLTIKNLIADTQYFWKVKRQNVCGESLFSETFSFRTSEISCLEVGTKNLPKVLQDASDSQEGETIAEININYDLPILDVNVLVDIEHTWVGDLTLYLESPVGTRYLLSSEIGDSDDNYTQTLFDQEASLSISESIAPFSGSFFPSQSISSLYGTSVRGMWRLVIIDKYTEDTGQLIDFSLYFCVQGIPMPNSDFDTLVDAQDNCPLLDNENQADIDQNGIGDVCDVFSAQNISLTKTNTSCPGKENGSLTFNARADFLYKANIIGPFGFQEEIVFSPQGKIVTNLAAGFYDICVRTNSFPDFEYCFETVISTPPSLEVQAVFNPQTSLLNLSLAGGSQYLITVNDKIIPVLDTQKVQISLTEKVNLVRVTTNNLCQGFFEQWINLDQKAAVFPNPVINEATIILPKERAAIVSLFSGAGDLLWQKKQQALESNVVMIPMNKYKKGWYLLRIDHGSYSETLKLLKR
tara:strand:- start:1293 stop:5123 length:3831 start_codon:yes stop_codon:yes gene_type:complete